MALCRQSRNQEHRRDNLDIGREAWWKSSRGTDIHIGDWISEVDTTLCAFLSELSIAHPSRTPRWPILVSAAPAMPGRYRLSSEPPPPPP